MLKFINEEDFLKVDHFVENDDGSVSWTWDEGPGLPIHSGDITPGFTREEQVQTGTQEVQTGTEQVERTRLIEDDEGNEVEETIFEEVPTYTTEPVFETRKIDVMAKLWDLHNDPDSPVNVERLPEDYFEKKAEEEALENFRRERLQRLNRAEVTTESGKVFDADEMSIARMMGRIQKEDLLGHGDETVLGWSLKTDPTGIFSEITLGELKEAFRLAVDNMNQIWSRVS